MTESDDPLREHPGPDAAASEAPAPADELRELREKAARADEHLEAARRARADFVNYQQRIRREREDWKRQALDDFVRDFLPALDAFTWARFEEPTLMESLRVVEREFLRVLAKHEIVPIETAGLRFDPALHEAVGVEPRSDVEPGTVLEEVRRGWRMGDAVLRPAGVRIAGARPSPESPGRS